MKRFFTLLLTSPLLLAATWASPVQEADAPRPSLKHYALEKGNLGAFGYDPVSYFAEGGGKPRKGDKSITLQHRGVTYRFANQDNRQLFQALPERYEPAYGGWCAWAMIDGEKVEPDPKSFLIDDGRLLLFYDGFLADTRKKWSKKGTYAVVHTADKSWEKISGEGRGRSLEDHNLTEGLGLSGYDPTAYAGGGAAQGQASLAAQHDGITYRFANDAARQRFLAAPADFEPHYGGYCAWAMAQGKKVAVDPTAFVRDEKGLFVFYNAAKRDEWKANAASLYPAAEREWKALVASR